jgi:hypothetical protein
MFVVFGASSVSAGMKAQTSNRPATPICLETGNFLAAPPNFQRSLLLDRLPYMGVFILAGKLLKLSTTFM